MTKMSHLIMCDFAYKDQDISLIINRPKNREDVWSERWADAQMEESSRRRWRCSFVVGGRHEIKANATLTSVSSSLESFQQAQLKELIETSLL